MALSEDIAAQVQYDLAQGMAEDEAAIKYGLTEEEIAGLVPRKRLNVRKELQNDLDIATEAVEVANQEYMAQRTQSAAFALDALMKRKQDLIDAVVSAEDPFALYDEIDKRVINPMVERFIKALAGPIQHFKEVSSSLVQPDHRRLYADQIKMMWSEMGESLKEAYRETRQGVATVLDIDLGDRIVQKKPENASDASPVRKKKKKRS